MRRPMTRLAALAAAAATTVLVAAARLDRVTVEGASMLPVLQPGDRLVVLPSRPQPGALVVLADPRTPSRTLVKRVHAVDGDGVEVRGDNPLHSTDSRTFGPVPPFLVHGRPVYRYAPAARAGWIHRD